MTAAIMMLSAPFTIQPAGAEVDWYKRLRVTKVSPTLYYGRQPRLTDIANLHQFGIKTIVSTRLNEAKTARQAAEARRLGMNHRHLPVGFFVPPNKELDEFVQIASNGENHPIYIHCQGGWHRAPMFVCAYRVKVEGWPYEKAYAELLSHGHFKPKFFRSLQRGLEIAARPARTLAHKDETTRKDATLRKDDTTRKDETAHK